MLPRASRRWPTPEKSVSPRRCTRRQESASSSQVIRLLSSTPRFMVLREAPACIASCADRLKARCPLAGRIRGKTVGVTLMGKRISRCVELLEQDQAIYYDGPHSGHVLTHAQGRI